MDVAPIQHQCPVDLFGDLKLDREFRLAKARREGGPGAYEVELARIEQEEREQAEREASQPVAQV